MVKCKNEIPMIMCMVESIGAPVRHQPQVNPLSELKGLPCFLQLIQYVFPLGICQNIVIPQIDIRLRLIIELCYGSMPVCPVVFLVYTECTFSKTAPGGKSDGVIHIVRKYNPAFPIIQLFFHIFFV